jgi:hypothetical protein
VSQQELLKQIVTILNRSEVDYMLTGSIVSSMQGEPRSTHDIDIIITVKLSKIDTLIKAFESAGFYISKQAVIEAVKQKQMFNVINTNSAEKVDFWVLSEEPFDRSRFERKMVEEFENLKLKISKPEDTILAKLRWAKLSGGSQKQYVDALRVYEVQYDRIDFDYMQKWAKILEVSDLWAKLQADAEPI